MKMPSQGLQRLPSHRGPDLGPTDVMKSDCENGGLWEELKAGNGFRSQNELARGGGEVPDPDGFVVRAGDEDVAVDLEGGDKVLVTLEDGNLLRETLSSRTRMMCQLRRAEHIGRC
jgi:hypothetical protein